MSEPGEVTQLDKPRLGGGGGVGGQRIVDGLYVYDFYKGGLVGG